MSEIDANSNVVVQNIQNFVDSQDNTKVGKWTNVQNLKYAIFMDFHKATLSSRHKKKQFKVFEEMANFIKSRNIIQCRSHHQKLEQRFKNFKKIISAVKNEIGRRQYKVHYKRMTNGDKELDCAQKIQLQRKIISKQQIVEIKQGQKMVVLEDKQTINTFQTPVFIFYPFVSLQNQYCDGILNFYTFQTSFF